MHRVEKQIIAEFLEMYKNLPCLWDVTDKFYSNKFTRYKAYDTLVEKYKQIDPECNQQMVKRKIENLRTTYRRERQKVIQSKYRSGDRYQPQLWYYPLFSFLEKLEHNYYSDDDSTHDSPELIEVEQDKTASSKEEITKEVRNSADMLEDIEPETVRATQSIIPNDESDIGIMTVSPEPETKYRPVKRPKPKAVYITETEYDYESETPSTSRTTKRRKKNKSKIDSTSIVIDDDDDDDEPLSRQVEAADSSGFAENDLFAKTMSAQLSELRPKQRFIAQKLMSEVIFYGRLDKLRTETKLLLDGD